MQTTERKSQYDKALMGLRSLVLKGEFEGTSRLPEVALSERLGVSRTPLRQAMAQLIDEGLLERIETGGCRVVRISMNDVIDAIELRGVIEGTAVRLAAERGADPDALAECRAVLMALDQAVHGADHLDFDAYVRHNARFHQLIVVLSGSTVMIREAERVARMPLASPSAFLQGQEVVPDFRASLRQAQAHHWAIFEAIENREGTRAEAMMREHARLARRNLNFVTKTKPNLIDRVPGLALVST